MSQENIVTAIDIGSSRIRTMIASFDESGKSDFHVLGIGSSYSQAMRRGNILDMEEFKSNIDSSLEEAEKMSGEPMNGVYLSINSSSFEVIQGKGVIAVSGDEISSDDVERVLDMARSGVDMPNREILKVVPEYFVVDLEEGVKNPTGMSARKLEVVANIFSMNKSVLDNIRRAIADVGVEIFDIYPNLLTAPESVLSKRQKELGVVCIDIGAATTGVSVFEEGVMKFASILPVGSDSVTSDIALGARSSIDIAEKLKQNYGELGLIEGEDKESQIRLSEIIPEEDGEITNILLSQIMTARYEEIFYFVNQELKKIGRDGMLPEGAVLVGGGVKAQKTIETAKRVLRLPVFVGVPVEKQSLSETSVSDPVFAGVVGCLIFGNMAPTGKTPFKIHIGGFFSSIIKVVKKILP